MTNPDTELRRLRWAVRGLGAACTVLLGSTLYFALQPAPEPAAPMPTPVRAAAPPQPVVPASTAPATARLTLLGSVVDADPARSAVWIRDEDTGQTARYRLGDELPDGRRVLGIDTEGAEIGADGSQDSLALQRASPKSDGKPSSPFRRPGPGLSTFSGPHQPSPGRNPPPPGPTSPASTQSPSAALRTHGARPLGESGDFTTDLEAFMNESRDAEMEFEPEDFEAPETGGG